MQIQISWLLQKPTDLDLHLQNRVYPGSAGQGLITDNACTMIFLKFHGKVKMSSINHCSLETLKGQLANSADPDQNTASDQGLHCLQRV